MFTSELGTTIDSSYTSKLNGAAHAAYDLATVSGGAYLLIRSEQNATAYSPIPDGWLLEFDIGTNELVTISGAKTTGANITSDTTSTYSTGHCSQLVVTLGP